MFFRKYLSGNNIFSVCHGNDKTSKYKPLLCKHIYDYSNSNKSFKFETKMKIRKAKKGDLKEIGKLMKREFSKPPFNERDSMKNVLKSLNFYFKIGEIFVAVSTEEIIGVIIVKFEQYWEGKVLLIEDLAVDRKFQNKGIGKELMKFVEDYAKKKNARFIFFKTHEKSKSINFYKRLGYKKDKNIIFMGKKIK